MNRNLEVIINALNKANKAGVFDLNESVNIVNAYNSVIKELENKKEEQ